MLGASSLRAHNNPDVATTRFPILQMREVGPREAKQLSWGHRAVSFEPARWATVGPRDKGKIRPRPDVQSGGVPKALALGSSGRLQDTYTRFALS